MPGTLTKHCYTSTGQGFLGYNPFAYCANNPVNCVDSGGDFLDTVFDVISIGFSIAEVVANPVDPFAWAGLAGDVIDLIPFVSGVGETIKAVGVVVDAADFIGDARKAAKVAEQADNIVDAARAVSKAAGPSSKLRKATGVYEITFKSGKNYVGKGGFKRAIQSAIDHSIDKKKKEVVDEVVSIQWKRANNHVEAFIEEFRYQLRKGVRNSDTYNKIWSPGKKLLASQ